MKTFGKFQEQRMTLFGKKKTKKRRKGLYILGSAQHEKQCMRFVCYDGDCFRTLE
jgi:hypothetical protein